MNRLLLFLFFSACCESAFAQPGSPLSASAETAAPAPSFANYRNSRLTYKIIPAPSNTWCYDVYADGRLMIHQPSIPGLPGNDGFRSKAAAAKVAQLVIAKIRRGEMPPGIEIAEMKKLKAI